MRALLTRVGARKKVSFSLAILRKCFPVGQQPFHIEQSRIEFMWPLGRMIPSLEKTLAARHRQPLMVRSSSGPYEQVNRRESCSLAAILPEKQQNVLGLERSPQSVEGYLYLAA